MPKFVTIGYGDEDGYNATDPAVRDAAHAHDAYLVERGAISGIAGSPVRVRNTDAAGVTTEHGPFLSAPLPLAGFGIIEAESLEAAIALAAGTTCAVIRGVVEVWPLQEAS
jgi:hypothetical protein